MTQKELLQTYHDRFHEVLESKSPAHIKQARYEAIMADMQKALRINILRPSENCWKVMNLYYHINSQVSCEEVAT